MKEHTILIFVSDNGYFHGEHRLKGKLIPYEEALRVPLFIRHPALSSGQVLTHYVLLNDLAPTILEWADVTPTLDFDGRSLVRLFDTTPPSEWRLRFLSEFSGVVRLPNFPHFFGVRTAPEDTDTPNQLYVQWEDEDDSFEFYELITDTYQLTNTYGLTGTEDYIDILEDHLAALRVCEGPSNEEGSCQEAEDSPPE